MATKQELEVQVADLTAQLAAAKSSQPQATLDPASSQTLIEKIESDLRATLKNEIDALNSELSTTKKDLYFLHKQLDQEKSLSASLDKELESARKTLENLPSLSGTSLVINGHPHNIVERERMVDLVEKWRKKYVNDDDTALIVVKKV